MRPRFLGTRQHSRVVGGSGSTQRYRAAKSRARTSGHGLVRIDLASVLSKYVVQTERNINRMLDEAQRANAILYFDEADNLFDRTDEEGTRARAAKHFLVSGARRRRLKLVTGRQAMARSGSSEPAVAETDDEQADVTAAD